MLIPNKAEVEAVAALLVEGDESPEALAKRVIKAISELREQREQFFTVVELSPGVYCGEGPYPTRDAAIKSTAKNTWITHFGRKWSVASMFGQSHNLAMQKEAADKPPAQRGDWAEITLDTKAAKAGWKGKAAERQAFLNT